MAEFPLLRAKWSETNKLALCGSNTHRLLTLTTFAFSCNSVLFSLASMGNQQPAKQEDHL